MGAWTRTAPRFPGALTRFFPENFGLATGGSSSARGTASAMQLQRRGVFRGCSHSIIFRLPCSLDLPVAPTSVPGTLAIRSLRAARGSFLPEGLESFYGDLHFRRIRVLGSQAVYATQWTGCCHSRTVVSLRSRIGQLERRDSHPLEQVLVGRYSRVETWRAHH
jgi:hypothetical protein